MNVPIKSSDGIWRPNFIRTLTELADLEGLSRQTFQTDLTPAEMKRLNTWLTKRRLNVTPEMWRD